MAQKKILIQDKINELDKLVEYFEQDESNFNLDQGIEKYEQAMKIVSEIKKDLHSYELKIKEIELKYADEGNLEEE